MPSKKPLSPPAPPKVLGKDAARFRLIKNLLDEHLARQEFDLATLLGLAEAQLHHRVRELAVLRSQPQHAGGVHLALLRDAIKVVDGRDLTEPEDKLRAYLDVRRTAEDELRELPAGESEGHAAALGDLDLFAQVEHVFRLYSLTPTPPAGEKEASRG